MKTCFFRSAARALVLLIFALSFTSLSAQNGCFGELILQPDVASGKDLHVSNWQPNQPGASTANWLTTAAWTISGDPAIWHTYIDFDWSALPAGAQVLSATLNLYGVNTGGSDLATHSCLSGNNNSIIRRVTSTWNATTMTWNTQPGTTSLNEVAVPALCIPNQDVAIDVKAMVQDMVSNPSTSFGFQISLATEQHYRGLIFGSSEHPDPSKRPKLMVQYWMPCPCTGQLVLQPDEVSGKDLHVSNYQPNQPGASTANWLTTAAWTISGDPALWHTYIDFDWSVLPAGAQVLNATLDLYGVNTGGGGDFAAHSCLSGNNNSIIRRVTSAWDQTTMTWNTQPTTTSLNELAVPALCIPNQNISLNITALVQDMVDNPSTSFGFQLSLATEQYYRGLIFGSSEHPDPTKRPKLIVQYTEPCPGEILCNQLDDDGDGLIDEGELVLQPNGAMAKDAAVWSKPDEADANFGNHQLFNAQAWTWDGVPGTTREYFDFDLTTIPPDATITSATFSLTAWPWNMAGEPCLNGSNEAYIRRVTSPWAENTITWNNQPGVTSTGQKYIPALCTANTNLDIDLTAMVQDMVSNPANNFGLQFALITEDYYRAMLFHASDSDEAAKRPKLVVQYYVHCDSSVSIAEKPIFQNKVQLSPNPTSGEISLKLEQSLKEPASLRLFSLQGKLLRQELLPSGTVQQQLDLTLFPAGLYVLEIQTDSGAVWHIKLVKQ